ncbi:MAG: GntR family transcriptional regulator, transcriptional repressor for pyruvate dehydrogenase complex, partial [Actinomycetota bacterium]|nr:GntR family transcriptional regulator, transcriptional repressor for pyruvate dehydrogenase complex [Actinomycetota bacterium]
VTAFEVTEARKVFELGILPLVIERATDDDVAELFDLVDRADIAQRHESYTMAHSAAFHTRVAACTHNAAIEMIVQSFHGPLLMSLREAQTVAPLMGRKGVREHRKYVETIRDRDVDTARKVMTDHLDRTAARVQRRA